MPAKQYSTSINARSLRTRKNGAAAKEVPIQVMVPEDIRRQVALMSAENGESIRTVVLRGLKRIGIDVPDSELVDRRGRIKARRERRNGS
nr:hypothetical protein [Nitrosomonas nitrosa]